MLSMLQLASPDGSKANLLLELNETELQNLIKTLQTVDEVSNRIHGFSVRIRLIVRTVSAGCARADCLSRGFVGFGSIAIQHNTTSKGRF
jgi:hypothetical protein